VLYITKFALFIQIASQLSVVSLVQNTQCCYVKVYMSVFQQDAVHVQIANANELDQHHHQQQQEIIGELDPQTGILYTSTPFNTQAIDTGTISHVTHLSTGTTIVGSNINTDMDHSMKDTSTAPPVDFLTSALSQAQINLDPYELIEDEDGDGDGDSGINTPQMVSTQSHVSQHQGTTPTQLVISSYNAAAAAEEEEEKMDSSNLISILGSSTSPAPAEAAVSMPQQIMLNPIKDSSPDGE
jgi:hypothetical protein